MTLNRLTTEKKTKAESGAETQEQIAAIWRSHLAARKQRKLNRARQERQGRAGR